MKPMNPKVFFDPKVYAKIMHWVDKATGEVSGLGKVVVNERGDIFVTSACLIDQENGATSTELNADAVAKAMFLTKDEPGELRFWWHSHVNMEVFWSGTDTDTMQQLGEHGWFVSTVFNKKREQRTAIYSKVPYRAFMDNVQSLLGSILEDSEVDAWDAEFAEKCKEKKWNYTPDPTKGSGYNAWRDQLGYDDDGLPGFERGQGKPVVVTERDTPPKGVAKLEKHGHWNDYPIAYDELTVTTEDGMQMSRAEYEREWEIDLADPEVMAWIGLEDHEEGVSNATATSN